MLNSKLQLLCALERTTLAKTLSLAGVTYNNRTLARCNAVAHSATNMPNTRFSMGMAAVATMPCPSVCCPERWDCDNRTRATNACSKTSETKWNTRNHPVHLAHGYDATTVLKQCLLLCHELFRPCAQNGNLLVDNNCFCFIVNNLTAPNTQAVICKTNLTTWHENTVG